jgi:hypothetical protein
MDNKAQNRELTAREIEVLTRLYQKAIQVAEEHNLPRAEEAHKNGTVLEAPVPDGMKRCGHCRTVLEANHSNFHKASKSRDGWQNWCIACTWEYNEQKRLKRATAMPVAMPPVQEEIPPMRLLPSRAILPRDRSRPKFKVCSLCDRRLPFTLDYYAYNVNAAHHLRHYCLECGRRENGEATAQVTTPPTPHLPEPPTEPLAEIEMPVKQVASPPDVSAPPAQMRPCRHCHGTGWAYPEEANTTE